MKKHTEKQPIDDLFARKLGNMSLPPSPNGFERLQARMGQGKPEAGVVFWRNPAMQRYMAAAACLLLVSLFGWLYWPTSVQKPNGSLVATNQKVLPNSRAITQKQVKQQAQTPAPDAATPDFLSQETPANQVAQVEKTSIKNDDNRHVVEQSSKTNKAALKILPSTSNEPVLTQIKPVEGKNIPEVMSPDVVTPSNPVVADNQTISKPAPPAERGLVVTIAEPELLVAARQAAKASVEDKAVVAVNGKPERDAKEGGLWQQVKRIKQGEVFARRDNPDNDERGLLGRAYSGLKQSFEKDKPAKQ